MAVKTRNPGEKKALTDEQRAHLDRMRARAVEIRAEKAALKAAWKESKADQSPPQTTVAEDAGVVMGDRTSEEILANLAAVFAQAAGNKAAHAKALGEVEAVLSKLSPKDFPELAESPVIQQFLDQMAERNAELHPDDPPGTIYNRGTLGMTKKRWQWSDLKDAERVRLTPTETIPITYQGLTMVLQADMDMEIPKPFYDVYMERRRGMETARQHAAFLFRQRDNIDPNRADPSVLSSSSGMVRGHGQGNTGYKPGAGAFNPGEEPTEEATA